MGYPQTLHPKLIDNEFYFSGEICSQTPGESTYNLYTLGISPQFEYLTDAIPMNSPPPQNMCRSQEPTRLKYWPTHNVVAPMYDSNMAATVNDASNSVDHPECQNWASTCDLGSSISWENALQLEPYVMSGFDSPLGLYNELEHSNLGLLNPVDKNDNDYCGQSIWMPSRLNGLPRGLSVNRSDQNTNDSLSPVSYPGENLQVETPLFSPYAMSDDAVSFGQWKYPHTSSSSLDESFPQIASSKSYMTKPNAEPSAEGFGLGIAKMDSSIKTTSVPAAKASFSNDASTVSLSESHGNRLEYSYPHESRASFISWHLPGYSHTLSDAALASLQLPQGTSINSTPAGASNLLGRSQAIIPSNLQDRFQTSREADMHAQRKLNDEVLLQGKKNGLTYKEIREKMVGEKPAESTLRGRYRSLTKIKKDRVRKPIWKKRDTELLNAVVEKEIGRIESLFPHPHSISLDQKLSKVAWKKVADHIIDHGGSYHFGNSTCKRKWLEINPPTRRQLHASH